MGVASLVDLSVGSGGSGQSPQSPRSIGFTDRLEPTGIAQRPLKLLTFTTLFPNREQPNHGVFVENRLRHLVAGRQVESIVVAPVPYFPLSAPWFGRWGRYARVPASEERH